MVNVGKYTIHGCYGVGPASLVVETTVVSPQRNRQAKMRSQSFLEKNFKDGGNPELGYISIQFTPYQF